MEFTGRYTIPTTAEAVWAAINDPEVLKACIPGCESLEKRDPTHFAASVRLKIGPMSATFKGNVQLTDLDPPRRCVLKGEGQGGVAGFAKGEAEVLLNPEGDGTALAYSAKATVGGKLAQVGQRLIDGAARQIADEFFTRFASRLTTMETSETIGGETALAPPPQVLQEPSAAPPVREGLAPEIWVVGLVAIIVILLVLFGLVL
jgi:uncharacterized protein